MPLQALRARPRRRRLPPDLGERQGAAVAPNVLDRTFEAPAPNRNWIADFTYVWTAEGWLYVAAVVGDPETMIANFPGARPRSGRSRPAQRDEAADAREGAHRRQHHQAVRAAGKAKRPPSL